MTVRELEALDAKEELERKAERARRRRRTVLVLLRWATISALTIPGLGVPGAILVFVTPLLVAGLAVGALYLAVGALYLAVGALYVAFMALSRAGRDGPTGWRKTKPDGPIERLIRRVLPRGQPTPLELLARHPRNRPPE